MIRINIKKLVPYALLVMGMLLVVRGMNLGIPYLSPEIQKNEQNEEILGGCCTVDKPLKE
jgi:heme oxygenase